MSVQINLFDLNLLRALDTLLQEKSVTRAAERLHVTQQAMSGSLKRLREHFGDDLLVRNGLRLEPTPLGVALLVPVREAMLQIALAVEATPSFEPGEVRRRFRIALSDYTVASFMPRMMERLLAEAPGLGIDVHNMRVTAFSNLASGDLDFTVQPRFWRESQENLPSGLKCSFLYEDDFVCAVDACAHDFDELSVKRYLELPHATTRLHDGRAMAVGVAWTKNGFNPQVAFASTSFSNTLLTLPGTPMVATVQRRLARQFAKVLPIRIHECPFPIDPLQEELYWHERSDDDPAHRFVRDLFAGVGRELSSTG